MKIQWTSEIVLALIQIAFLFGVAWTGVKLSLSGIRGKIKDLREDLDKIRLELDGLTGSNGARLVSDCVPIHARLTKVIDRIEKQYGIIAGALKVIEGRFLEIDKSQVGRQIDGG